MNTNSEVTNPMPESGDLDGAAYQERPASDQDAPLICVVAQWEEDRPHRIMVQILEKHGCIVTLRSPFEIEVIFPAGTTQERRFPVIGHSEVFDLTIAGGALRVGKVMSWLNWEDPPLVGLGIHEGDWLRECRLLRQKQ